MKFVILEKKRKSIDKRLSELKMINIVYFIFLSYFHFYLFSYFGLRVQVIV